MTIPVILRPGAEGDVECIFSEFESIRTGLGNKFSTQLRKTLGRLEEFPRLYPVVRQQVRAVRLSGFRHVVYYHVFADRVEVIAVMHGSRERSAWQSRV